MYKKIFLSLALCSSGFCSFSNAQDCAPPAIVANASTNAFNIPGGHVILTRKLIAFVANEDELMGVIAHELGHGVVRHGTLDTSEALRKILNVTALGDKADDYLVEIIDAQSVYAFDLTKLAARTATQSN